SIDNNHQINYVQYHHNKSVIFLGGEYRDTSELISDPARLSSDLIPDVAATISNPSDGAVLGTVTAGIALTEGDPAPSYSISANTDPTSTGSNLSHAVTLQLADGESVTNSQSVN